MCSTRWTYRWDKNWFVTVIIFDFNIEYWCWFFRNCKSKYPKDTELFKKSYVRQISGTNFVEFLLNFNLFCQWQKQQISSDQRSSHYQSCSSIFFVSQLRWAIFLFLPTGACAYWGVRNVRFLENWTCFVLL